MSEHGCFPNRVILTTSYLWVMLFYLFITCSIYLPLHFEALQFLLTWAFSQFRTLLQPSARCLSHVSIYFLISFSNFLTVRGLGKWSHGEWELALKKKKSTNVDTWSNTEKFTASYLENKHFPAKNSQSVEVPITDVRFGPRIGRFVTSGWPGRLRLSVIFPWVCWRDRTMRWHCWQRSCWWWDPVRWTFKNGSKM